MDKWSPNDSLIGIADVWGVEKYIDKKKIGSFRVTSTTRK
jgi:hypothetical protein